MESKMKIALCGGDARLLSAAALFAKNGYTCTVWKCAPGDCGGATRCHELRQAVDGIGAVILPVPAFTSAGRLTCTSDERTGIDAQTLFAALPPETKIYAGKVSELIRRIAGEYHLPLWDYAEQEEFSILNAVPTAEAAVQIVMNRLPVTIAGSKFVVIGYGRVGRALAQRLLALQGKVIVAARSKAARAAAESDGCETISVAEYLSAPIPALVCFNTVPAPIIHDECAASADCRLFIDLASAPGGFREEARSILGDQLITALSLPGKYSHETAGKIIYKTVQGMLTEKGGTT
ncbi:MAG: hypothetical protein KHW59_07435 [Clostridiales bacterium]|nr:hypothetical protein [Clostridiales bacterium]